jgi:septal ring factor EnvC (AmiA/AmiB activator)
LQSDLGVVEKRLRVTQSDLKKARDEEAKIREEDAQKLAQMDTDVKSQLATKASTDELNNDLNTVNGSVNNVKTDLEGTKNDLKMARSELGTLIARNHEEIDVLRRMGERDYVEFTINGKNKPQKVGAITIELRSVDTKKNKFTVALTVDDNRTEKKDRLVDEPVVFYPRGSHQADEFVVNSVAKDKISGYISVPKNPPATTANASGG